MQIVSHIHNLIILL